MGALGSLDRSAKTNRREAGVNTRGRQPIRARKDRREDRVPRPARGVCPSQANNAARKMVRGEKRGELIECPFPNVSRVRRRSHLAASVSKDSLWCRDDRCICVLESLAKVHEQSFRAKKMLDDIGAHDDAPLNLSRQRQWLIYVKVMLQPCAELISLTTATQILAVVDADDFEAGVEIDQLLTVAATDIDYTEGLKALAYPGSGGIDGALPLRLLFLPFVVIQWPVTRPVADGQEIRAG
jgi:hypothetical protein